MKHEEMMQQAWQAIHELGITDNPSEATDETYLVEDIFAVRDAFYKDIENGNAPEGEDLDGFFTRHGIRCKFDIVRLKNSMRQYVFRGSDRETILRCVKDAVREQSADIRLLHAVLDDAERWISDRGYTGGSLNDMVESISEKIENGYYEKYGLLKSSPKKTLILYRVGYDNWDRPLYKDAEGKKYVDTDAFGKTDTCSICTVTPNGEPDMSLDVLNVSYEIFNPYADIDKERFVSAASPDNPSKVFYEELSKKAYAALIEQFPGDGVLAKIVQDDLSDSYYQQESLVDTLKHIAGNIENGMYATRVHEVKFDQISITQPYSQLSDSAVIIRSVANGAFVLSAERYEALEFDLNQALYAGLLEGFAQYSIHEWREKGEQARELLSSERPTIGIDDLDAKLDKAEKLVKAEQQSATRFPLNQSCSKEL